MAPPKGRARAGGETARQPKAKGTRARGGGELPDPDVVAFAERTGTELFILPEPTRVLVGLSESALRRAVREGNFPAPVQVTESKNPAICFVLSEVRAWQRARMAARGPRGDR